MKFNPVSKERPRSEIVARNIESYKSILNAKYESNDFLTMSELLSPEYRWYGAIGTGYSYEDEEERADLLEHATAFRQAVPDISMKHHMFGEGNMVGNYCVVEGTHTGSYLGVKASGNRVNCVSVSIARFDTDGLLIEERELWDEMTFLRQFGYISDMESKLIIGLLVNRPHLPESCTYPEISLPEFSDILFNAEGAIPLDRDPVVVRNIKNWLGFTDKKYMHQDFEGIHEVMSENYQHFAGGGYHSDVSDSASFQSMCELFKREMDEHPDINFESELFGEGDMVAYNVAPHFTHTDHMLGVAPSDRKVRFFNISIGRFGEDGRIAEETELHDFLALYKQIGVISNSPKNVTLLDVLKELNRAQ